MAFRVSCVGTSGSVIRAIRPWQEERDWWSHTRDVTFLVSSRYSNDEEATREVFVSEVMTPACDGRADAATCSLDPRLVELMNRYQTPLLNFLLAIAGDHDLAHECAQETLVRAYDSLRRGKDVNRAWHVTPLEQIPLSVAMPYYGPTAVYGMRGVVSVLAGLTVHPSGLILSSFFSNKAVTVVRQPELSGRRTWELRGVQVPGVPVVPTLGDSWTMWVDQETGVVLRLEYYSGATLIGWAAIQDFTVNAPASTLPHFWSMPTTARKVDMTTYLSLRRPKP